MSRFDRYVLSQLLVLFGFFSLILVSVYWINRAVRLFDTLIADGQSTRLFFELTALTLPNVIGLMLPISSFAAAVYVTNRLSNDSELAVMQATGFSPWRMARPVLIFGLIVAAMMSVITHFLGPASLKQLSLRRAEIAQDVTAQLLTEGTFLHPDEGVTFFIRRITPEGALRDVFLSDRSRRGGSLVYTATEAYLLRDGDALKLVMVDGMTQHLDAESGQLSTTHFSDFTHDISSLIGDPQPGKLKVRDYPTVQMLRDRGSVAEATNQSIGRVLEEVHGRFTQPLMSLVAALVGFVTLLLGGYSRFGVWPQIQAAFLIMVVLRLLDTLVVGPVRAGTAGWGVLYAPLTLGLIVTVAMLWAAERPALFLRRRREAT